MTVRWISCFRCVRIESGEKGTMVKLGVDVGIFSFVMTSGIVRKSFQKEEQVRLPNSHS